jgi:hypothetical protein
MMITGKVRFSYANVFQPKAAMDGGEPKYSIVLLIPKSDTKMVEDIKKDIEGAKQAGKDKWNGKIPTNLKTPLRDGDEERPDREEFKGMYFISATSKTKPQIVDAQLQAIIDPTEFYSGCYGRASINFYAYSVNGNRGIACGLGNLQKLADGDSFTGRKRAEDEFTAFAPADDGDDF